MTEEHPTLPTTVYGASKLAGECYARAFFRTYEFPAVIVRPFNAYGPRSHHEGDSGEVIPRFMLRGLAGRRLVIFGNGSQTRDFSYVSDTASGILTAGLAPGIEGETINLGSGQETAIRDLASAVARVLEQDSLRVEHQPPRPGDVQRHCADGGKAARLLGYRPRVSLREGLAELRDWYRGLGCSVEELLAAEVVHNWDRGKLAALTC
jgi:UDP-glucose 4-epimerase